MKSKEVLGVWGGKLRIVVSKYRYVFLVILIGIVLLLLPTSRDEEGTQNKATPAAGWENFDVERVEHKLEAALSEVEGAGNVSVVLTVKSGVRQILAQDSKINEKDGGRDSEISTVVVSKGSGAQETVSLQELSPQFQGALVVCAGGNDPVVRLKLVEAVSALTGLGSDKISICKGK